MKKLGIILLVFTIQFCVAQNISLTDKLPMDPAVKVGKLHNGLTYYIKKNTYPKDRAELRLVINAGSILETDQQQGLAHFMEHMNFNGTKNFPKNELVNFLEKSGIKFGADLNAYTSFNETVYMLPVPTDTLDKLEKYISVLADWSGNASLDPQEIDKERGVVLEEARLRKGANQRISEKLYPVLFRGSLYAQRLPIGKEEIIQNAPYSEFKKFKEDWYRPNLQAVIAVGDFDPSVIENIIKKYFDGFTNPANAPERKQFTLPSTAQTDVAIITDKEQPYNVVQHYRFHAEKKQITAQDKRESLVASLVNTMLANRMNELTKKTDAPILAANMVYGNFLADADVYQSLALAKGADIEKALICIRDENERAKRFGFTQGELDRAKLSYAARLDKMLAEKDKTHSQNYVNELVNVFLNDRVMTDIAFDKQFADQYLNEISIKEANSFIQSVLESSNQALVVLGSEKDNFPTIERLKQILAETNPDLKPYQDETIAKTLIEKMPQAGKIKLEQKFKEIDVTEITFENGIKVLLKPTDFKNDEISFRGVRYGGLSNVNPDDYDNASFASVIASQSGSGALSSSQLSKFLMGKQVNVDVGFNNYNDVVLGTSNTKDFETALQLLYNKFTNTQLDQEAVKSFLNSSVDLYQNLEKNPTPENVYSDTLSYVLANYHYTAKPMTAARFAQIDPVKSLEYFNKTMSDASGFKFIFAGNFDIENIKPLLATYIGSLPTSGNKPTYNDLKIFPPKGKVTKVVKKGTEDKATVSIVLSNPFSGSDNDEVQLNALTEILQLKLTEKLREEEGGVYSPQAYIVIEQEPNPNFSLHIKFGCAPANVDKLVKIALNEVNVLTQKGGTKEEIEKFVNNEKLNYQTYLKNNNYWLAQLTLQYLRDKDLNKILNYEADLQKLTPTSTQQAAAKYLKGDNVLQVILLPEN